MNIIFLYKRSFLKLVPRRREVDWQGGIGGLSVIMKALFNGSMKEWKMVVSVYVDIVVRSYGAENCDFVLVSSVSHVEKVLVL